RHVQRSSKIPRATANDFGEAHAWIAVSGVLGLRAELEIRQSTIAPTADLGVGQDYLDPARVLPTGRLIQQFRFDVECRFDVHLRARIGSCSERLLGRRWPLGETPRSNFHRRLRGAGGG